MTQNQIVTSGTLLSIARALRSAEGAVNVMDRPWRKRPATHLGGSSGPDVQQVPAADSGPRVVHERGPDRPGQREPDDREASRVVRADHGRRHDQAGDRADEV